MTPIPMLLWCPMCGARHIDEGEFATKPHHTHSCQECGLTWRPAVVPTCGVQFLPGFKNDQQTLDAPAARVARVEAAVRAVLDAFGRDDVDGTPADSITWVHECDRAPARAAWLALRAAVEEPSKP